MLYPDLEQFSRMPLTSKLAEWETLSKLAYVSSVPDNRKNIGNPFNNVFRYLMLFKLHGGIRTSESILIYLVSNILWETNVGESL